MSEQVDRPIYVHRWINDDGLEESFAVTPRMLMYLGGAALLFAVAFAIYKFTQEHDANWMSGGFTLWDLIGTGVPGGLVPGMGGFGGTALNSVIGAAIQGSVAGQVASNAPELLEAGKKIWSKLKGLM